MGEPMIDIIMSTYNGSLYLQEQLESIRAQTYNDWRLIVRDDGSKDNTLDILLKYQQLLGNKFVVIKENNIGVVKSFEALLERTKASYIMFADQDDVWMPDKLEYMLKEIKRQECMIEVGKPVMVFSDLELVDERLRPIARSFWKSHGINPNHISLGRLLLQNVVTGCACIFNRALIEVAMPIHQGAIMHDWWLALNACIYGKLVPLDRATVKYRQHGKNQVGAKNLSANRLLALIAKPAYLRARVKEIIANTSRQAESLICCRDDKIESKNRELVAGFAELPKQSYIMKRKFMINHDIRFSNNYRNIALFLLA